MPRQPRPLGAALALDVTLSWRDDVIALRRLQGEGVAAVGAHREALAPIPCSSAAAEGFVVARVSAGAAVALAPEGCLATLRRADGEVELVEGPARMVLEDGDRAELVLGAFRLVTAATVPEALPRGGRRRAPFALGALALAAMAHAVVLGLAAGDARASSAEAREEERTAALAGLLASAEHRARGDDTPIEDGGGKGDGRAVNGKHGDGRAGGGERARGEQGKMGDRMAHGGEARRYAVPERVARDRDPATARAEALTDAGQFGMIGLLAQGPQVPVASFAEAWAHGADALAANGAMWARLPGEAAGEAGLGLTGIGEGGGGSGDGIGLGRVGTLGHTDGAPGRGGGGDGSPAQGGSGHWGSWDRWGTHRARAPYCRCGYGYVSVSGRLPPDVIQRIVRQNHGRFRACYEAGLTRSPALAGRVSTRFVIDAYGAVASAVDGGSDLPDSSVVSCVVRAFSGISFPQPEGGIVTVSYPIQFSPG